MGIKAIKASNELPQWVVDRQMTKEQRAHDDDYGLWYNKPTYKHSLLA